MSLSLSERSHLVLVSSLPTVEAHRALIVEGMAASLAASVPDRDAPWPRRAAACLVDMLIEQARHFAAGEDPQDLAAIRLEHLRNDIHAAHHARFGDAIANVMVDAAGAALPKSVGAAWCEAFWAVIGRIRLQEAQAIASGPGAWPARRAAAAAAMHPGAGA